MDLELTSRQIDMPAGARIYFTLHANSIEGGDARVLVDWFDCAEKDLKDLVISDGDL